MPKAKNKPEPEVFIPEKGGKVSFDMDGEETFGIVTSVDKKKQIAEVKGEDGTLYDCRFDELTGVPDEEEKEEKEEEEEEEKPSKKSSGKKVKEADEDEGGGKKSYASAFNRSKPKERGGGFPVGNHEALVNGGECSDTDKGIKVKIQFVGVNGEEVEGKIQHQFYNLKGENGEWNEDGVGFFKRDMIEFGFDEDDLTSDASDDEEFVEFVNGLLKRLKKMLPWVAIRVVEQKNKPGFTNIFINGLMEDQDQKPELPS